MNAKVKSLLQKKMIRDTRTKKHYGILFFDTANIHHFFPKKTEAASKNDAAPAIYLVSKGWIMCQGFVQSLFLKRSWYPPLLSSRSFFTSIIRCNFCFSSFLK